MAANADRSDKRPLDDQGNDKAGLKLTGLLMEALLSPRVRFPHSFNSLSSIGKA